MRTRSHHEIFIAPPSSLDSKQLLTSSSCIPNPETERESHSINYSGLDFESSPSRGRISNPPHRQKSHINCYSCYNNMAAPLISLRCKTKASEFIPDNEMVSRFHHHLNQSILCAPMTLVCSHNQ